MEMKATIFERLVSGRSRFGRGPPRGYSATQPHCSRGGCSRAGWKGEAVGHVVVAGRLSPLLQDDALFRRTDDSVLKYGRL